MGSLDERVRFPHLPETFGPLRRYFWVYVFLAALPHVEAYCRARAIPEHTVRHTLMDLGRKMALHRKRYGVGGFDLQYWLTLHFRGAIFDLGRLQFQRARLGKRTGDAIAAAGLPFGPDDLALSVHIPNAMGPMSQAACDASFERARAFFARHYAEEPYRVAVCHSWLLDPQLPDYLPETSNIIRFQRRFEVFTDTEPADWAPLEHLFRRRYDGPRVPAALLDELPQETTLQRAVVAHLRNGGHWYNRTGWFPL
jgi:hypothetical protein